MSLFKELLNESLNKEYGYRIKFAADCGAEHLDMLEKCLQKYNVVSVAPFKRTPIQENPVEFVRAKGVKCVSEVCSTDVIFKYPTNARILEVWLAVNMGIAHDHVLCYDVKEPRMAQNEGAAVRLADDVDRMPTEEDALLAEDEYADEDVIDHDDFYGEGHKDKFTAELARIKAEKGADYFRNYPTKDEIMGDNLRTTFDELMNGTNMGKGTESKEVSINDQNLGGPS